MKADLAHRTISSFPEFVLARRRNRHRGRFGRCLAVLLAAGLLAGSGRGGPVSYSYDAAGRLVAADHGAGKSISYAYDNAGNLIQSSQPAPGLVLGAVAGNQFTLSWPAAPGGFTLETSPTVNPGAAWTNANLTTTLNGNRLTVIISVGSGTRFYRLRKP